MNQSKYPNQETLNRALNIYREAMRPFLRRCLKQVRGTTVEELSEERSPLDVGDFAHCIRRYWDDVFALQFNTERDIRSRVGMIADARNLSAHPGAGDLDREDTRARLNDIAYMLGAINCPIERQQVEGIRDNLIEEHEKQQKGTDMPALTTSIRSANPTSSGQKQPNNAVRKTKNRRKGVELPAWRDVIRPNEDVITGTFRKSEFAADLQEVYEGRAKTAEYGEAEIFFNQTYITPGLRGLIVNTLRRLSGNQGGEPVIQMKTGFGGGKTHSLIALYHLVTSAEILTTLPEDTYARLRAEIHDIMQEAEWHPAMGIDANVSVLVGTYLSTTDADATKRGEPLNTLWGMMANQLGGQDAYDIIGEAARQGISPGGKQLDALFEKVGPSVILIDELVAYVRNVTGVTQDSIYTFLQTLTESVRRCEHIALVVTLPESQTQAGAAAGNEALQKLEELLAEQADIDIRPDESGKEEDAGQEANVVEEIFERIENVWAPLEINEAFEVVRRRLFGSEIDEDARDLTCEAFRKHYQNARREYPDNVSDAKYLQRMKDCYPIHPEVFDRLHSDWGAVPGFQRTRGVLRIMANCISRLYQRENRSPMIMPADLTLSDPSLADEFTGLLSRQGGQWPPVITEVDSDGGLTDRIDSASQSFLDMGGAARRVARTVFFGSAPSGAVKGINIRSIHLGTVLPGQSVSVYNDALHRMSNALYFLYNLDDRYYFHAEENLTKVAVDRSKGFTEGDVHGHIIEMLNKTVGRDPGAHVCPTSPREVPDSDRLQIVILPPHRLLPSRHTDSDTARAEVEHILRYRGSDETQRAYRNTLLFIGARRGNIRELENIVRSYLAWDSILNGHELYSAVPNLKDARFDQTVDNVQVTDDAARERLFKTYRRLLVPSQENPRKDEYHITETEISPDDGRILWHARKQFEKDETIITDMAPALFADMLSRYIWSSENYQEHIVLDTLWEFMARHLYMPRLKSPDVLIRCIRAGVAEGHFGYAQAYEDGNYVNHRFLEPVSGAVRIGEGSAAVLISPEMAKLLMEEPVPEPEPEEPLVRVLPEADSAEMTGPRRVVVTKTLQLEIDFREDIEFLQSEIARALHDDGGEVTVEVIVTADKADGFSENTARSVKNNSAELGAEFQG